MPEHGLDNGDDATYQAQVALAIVESVSGEPELLDRVEGVLLTAAGDSESVTPAGFARRVGIERTEAVDLFRQLERVNAVRCDETCGKVAQSAHMVNPVRVREALETVRQAARLVEAQAAREPASSLVEPLVTLPDDPTLTSASPAQFGMRWLMPALTDEVRAADERIVVLNPFFEDDGFLRLQEAFFKTLQQGTRVAIITRYLHDDTSHNHRVLTEFMDAARDMGVNTHQVTLVDYTAWDSHVPDDERRQNGTAPAFTLHAKLMLFDGMVAYLGSANVTDYSFEQYLELGALLRGTVVRYYEEFVEALLESDAATEVRL